MAPNKFEKHIKKQLEEREIQPSDNAWANLNERLDGIAPKSKKRDLLWYGVAASFIGILIVSVWYLNGVDSAENSVNRVVETEEKVIEPTISNGISVKDIEETVVKNDKIFEEESTIPKVYEVDENIVKTNKNFSEMDDTLQAKSPEYVSTEQVNIIVADKEVRQIETAKAAKILNTKILEVVAQVEAIEKQNIDLTDVQVDSLLRFAQKEIMTNKLFLKESKIDPMALLTDVEDELDQSFRDKIFERLRTGFAKVRTAVADSDN